MTRRVRWLGIAALATVLLGCGPTATALHSNAPRSANPVPSGAVPFETPDGGVGPGGPEGSRTPPPPGIAQPMTSFPQGTAYEIDGVTATPTGYVAVGYQYSDPSSSAAAQGIIWTSPDGMTWQQTVDPAFVNVAPYGVVALGNDVYVYGDYAVCDFVVEEDENCEESPNAGTVIFRSSNGGPWEQMAQAQDILDAEIDRITTWNNTLVATGYDANEGNSTLWTSTDALNWTPTSNLSELDSIDAVAAGGPGLVALGSRFVEEVDQNQLVGKTSPDGLTFNAASMPAATGATMSSVIAGPGGMAAVGQGVSDDQPSVGFALYSPDGVNWSEANASDNSFENAVVNDVFSTGSAYVAVGSTIDEDFTYQTGRIWISGDGHTWRSLGDFGGSFTQYSNAALGSAGLVVFTADDTDLGDDQEVPTSTILGWFLPTSQLVA